VTGQIVLQRIQVPITSAKLITTTLRQKIAHEIRQAILQRSLVPGERLVERELAQRLGTSLTAVREALIELEMEGLIEKKPNAATHVTRLSLEEVEEIFAVRRVLERYAFEEAARIADDASVRRLTELHRKAIQIAQTGDGAAYIAADFEWHEAAWQATRNSCLIETLRRLMVPLFGFSIIETATKEGFDLEEDAFTHAPLLNAIRDRDPAAAVRAFDRFFEVWRTQNFKGTNTTQDSEHGKGSVENHPH
jgi:DNA-binding GntR family transcriptional regulator